MTKYSRTAKYEDLRKSLMNDKEGEMSSPSLSAFEKRLNNINPATFKAPQEVNNDDHVPGHAKSRENSDTLEENSVSTIGNTDRDKEESDHLPNSGVFSSAYSNSLINEYINEVKKYNVDQGNAYSEDTTVNVLANLRDNASSISQSTIRPFGEPEHTTEVPSLSQFNAALKGASLKSEPQTNRPINDENTANIPNFSKEELAPDEKSSAYSSRADNIANEVQSLIQQQGSGPFVLPDLTGNYGTNTDTVELGRTTRQQLLNETTQIRAQVDDLSQNLEDINAKSERNGQLINIVMITLIIALLVALAVVLYWIFTM